MEVVGDECLTDLISRNIIFVHAWGSTGKMKFCKIHDLMRDLCLREAHKENFLYVPNTISHADVQGLSSQHRIFIQSTLSDEYFSEVLTTLEAAGRSLARSLTCDFAEVLPLRNFRLLRVMNMANGVRSATRGRYSLDDAFQLVNLRYIILDARWNIQILIVKCTWEETVAPVELWEMNEHKHIEFYSLYLPDSPNQPRRVALDKLHTLSGVKNFRCSEEAVMRIPNIKRLRLSFYTTGDLEEFCQKNLQLLKKLESLAFLIRCVRCPKRPTVLLHLPFPSSIVKLTLFGCELLWEDMTNIGSLPHLQVLKLKADAFIGEEWMPVEDEFLSLKFLLIDCCDDLVYWRADESHFPRLEHIFLRVMHRLVEIPPGIGEILTLHSIQLENCSDPVVISAKNIHEEQEDNGNFGLQVRVRSGSKHKLDSLATDNFRFESGKWNKRRWD